MPNLEALFESLEPPGDGGTQTATFSAVPVPSAPRHRLAKDAQGRPAFLLSATSGGAGPRPAPIQLEHLSAQHDADCRITSSDGNVTEGRFTVVQCTTSEQPLRQYFIRVLGLVIEGLGASSPAGEIAAAIDSLAELFRAMSMTPRKSVQGVWAEVFLISQSRRPRSLTAAWHTHPEERYDFSAGQQKLEVKSSSTHVRQHHFTLEQLAPPPGVRLLVASLFIERSGGGVSITDLADDIRRRLGSDHQLLLHLDRVVVLSLGRSWQRAVDERFDRDVALSSLKYYEPQHIPSVSLDLPPGVSDVHFRSDLTGCPSADLAAYRAMGGLFGNALR